MGALQLERDPLALLQIPLAPHGCPLGQSGCPDMLPPKSLQIRFSQTFSKISAQFLGEFSIFLLTNHGQKAKFVPSQGPESRENGGTRMSKSFGYKLPGYFMDYGPIPAATEDEAKAEIRRRLGVRRLPWGLQVWDLAERPLAQWRVRDAS